jgi:hypothetical protein
MLGYRRKSFAAAHKLLSELRTNLEEISPLLPLQRLLIKEITSAERQIRSLKQELSLQSAFRKSDTYIQNRIERLRLLTFIWRSFGDAIAFLYMDKFALKQTRYNIHNMNPRQDAGFLSDKKGLQGELTFRETLLARGIPSVLVDITNTIRHGDVCLMLGPDPQLIEVKTSAQMDRRGRKQVAGIRTLQDFLKRDYAQSFRGLPEIRRVEHHSPERRYLGLFYVAMKTNSKKSIPEIFSSIKVSHPWVFSLNEFKTKRVRGLLTRLSRCPSAQNRGYMNFFRVIYI